MMFRIKSGLILLLASVLSIASLQTATASVPEPRALALGGAYTTLATGSEALHWNPANLRMNRVPFELSFPVTGGLNAENTYFSLNRVLLEPVSYNTGEQFLADIVGNRFQVSAQGGFQSGLAISSFGLSLRGEARANVALSEGATRLFAVGTKPGSNHSFTDTGIEAMGLVSAGGGIAFAVPRLRINKNYDGSYIAIGTNLKTYRGLFYADASIHGTVNVSDQAEYEADLTLRGIYTDFEKVYDDGNINPAELAGQGYGVDFGITARPTPKLTVGMAVSNGISSMTWHDLVEVEGTIKGDLISADGDGPVFPEDPDDFTEYEETPVPSLTTKLPREVRAGASYRPWPQILIAADVAKTFTDGGIDHPTSLHLGAELTPFANAKIGRRLALRVGYERSGRQNYYSYGLGLGLWKWEIDAGVRLANSLNAVDVQGAAIAVTSRIRF